MAESQKGKGHRVLALDDVVAYVAAAVSSTEAIEPVAVRFLLSQYIGAARDDLSALLGETLGRALQQPDRLVPSSAAEWLLLFSDACAWSDDERLRAATAALLASMDRNRVDGIEAALRGSTTLGDGERLASAVDDLERLVAQAYEPGDGVASADQVAVSSMLLSAFESTGRVPYAMLAEELVQTWQRRGGACADAESASRAALVLGRLAALHADEDYVNAAVVAGDADYRADSARLLTVHASGALETPRVAARYGFALAHFLGLH